MAQLSKRGFMREAFDVRSRSPLPMKSLIRLIAILFVIGLLLVGLAVGGYHTMTYRGNTRVLNLMREIRHGMPGEQVQEILGRKPQVVPAASLPTWLEEVVPPKEKGEYWLWLMGFPSRILIIYMDENDEVGFVTWAPT